ncbi:MAG: histone deacetylase [Candidatus Omnitrophica bacterium]|nr:histone deacetylase [Candidatus Omnitrophota bacterium]
MSEGKPVVYSDAYYVDIGDHVFPTVKYKLVRADLIRNGDLSEDDFVAPRPARDEEILLVHERSYLDKLKKGSLTPEEVAALELPYSKELVRASYLCVGGTILACDIALESGVGIHLGGGFHHAFTDHGEGFCVFNDVAVGIKRSLEDGKIDKALVIDCDLHQGNGTAAIFKGDERVFTFSIHQQNNYPFFKPPSDLDIGLPDRTQDKQYLDALDKNIPKTISAFRPGLIIYVAGADPYTGDKIGNLGLTIEGLKKRDEIIFTLAKNYSIPIAVVLAGGYAERQEDTVKIHYNTITTVLKFAKEYSKNGQRV